MNNGIQIPYNDLFESNSQTNYGHRAKTTARRTRQPNGDSKHSSQVLEICRNDGKVNVIFAHRNAPQKQAYSRANLTRSKEFSDDGKLEEIKKRVKANYRNPIAHLPQISKPKIKFMKEQLDEDLDAFTRKTAATWQKQLDAEASVADAQMYSVSAQDPTAEMPAAKSKYALTEQVEQVAPSQVRPPKKKNPRRTSKARDKRTQEWRKSMREERKAVLQKWETSGSIVYKEAVEGEGQVVNGQTQTVNSRAQAVVKRRYDKKHVILQFSVLRDSVGKVDIKQAFNEVVVMGVSQIQDAYGKFGQLGHIQQAAKRPQVVMRCYSEDTDLLRDVAREASSASMMNNVTTTLVAKMHSPGYMLVKDLPEDHEDKEESREAYERICQSKLRKREAKSEKKRQAHADAPASLAPQPVYLINSPSPPVDDEDHAATKESELANAVMDKHASRDALNAII